MTDSDDLVLNGDEVESLLRAGIAIAPTGNDPLIVGNHLKGIKARSGASAKDAWAMALTREIEEPLLFVKPEILSALGKRKYFVIPDRLAAALATVRRGHELVLITTGMIDLIAAQIEDAYVQALLPEEAGQVTLDGFRDDMPLPEIFANLTFLFRLRAHRYAEPLPSVAELLTGEPSEHAARAVRGAITFTLLHELGHHECGHIDNGAIRMTYYETLINEDLTKHQLQEAEADQFALDAVVDEAVPVATYWMQQALSFFASLELVTGLHASNHPLALNRTAVSVRQRLRTDYCYGKKRHETDLAQLKARFGATATQSSPESNRLIQSERVALERMLENVVKALAEFGIDAECMLTPEHHNWLERMDGPHPISDP